MPDARIAVITGGIGGAKFVEGLYRTLAPQQLAVIPNVGDDDEFHGLWVSPDVDTLLYTLSNRVNRDTGWGLAGDTFRVQQQLNLLGQDVWMNLGDQDLATHLVRTLRRKQGQLPADITQQIARKLGVDCDVLLPTNSRLQTRLLTEQGDMSLEEYFVKHRSQPQVVDVYYVGAQSATLTAEAQRALLQADYVFIAPSNPLLSIAPTLAIDGVRQALQTTSARRIAISPLVGGKAIKGPTCEVMRACSLPADVTGVAQCYHGLIDTLVIDEQDQAWAETLQQRGLDVVIMNTLMTDVVSRCAFAKRLLQQLSFSMPEALDREIA